MMQTTCASSLRLAPRPVCGLVSVNGPAVPLAQSRSCRPAVGHSSTNPRSGYQDIDANAGLSYLITSALPGAAHLANVCPSR